VPKIINQELSVHSDYLKFFYYFNLMSYLNADHFAVVNRLFHHQSFFTPILRQHLFIIIVNFTCVLLLITDCKLQSYRVADADLAHRYQLNRQNLLPVQIMRLQCPFTLKSFNRETFLAQIRVFDKESVLVIIVF